jgi:hypothetical protein
MESLRKLEHRILGWVKDVPHLPTDVQAWLGRNVWIIVMVGAIIASVATFFDFINWLSFMAVASDPRSIWYVYGGSTAQSIVSRSIGYFFIVLMLIVAFAAVRPLKEQDKKGWVLLFVGWLLYVTSCVINAIISLNAFSFIMTLLLGATSAVILGYGLFEIHSWFSHKPVKAKVAAKTKQDDKSKKA